jgi:hypothetical protein
VHIVTEPERSRLKPAHWALMGIVVLLIVGVAFVVVSRDRDRKPTADPAPTPGAPSSGPACSPTVTEIGYSRTSTGRIDFGLIARSDCPSAAVNNIVNVRAIGADGKPIANAPGTALQPRLPVILPGQRLGLAGTLLVDRATKVSRLTATISDSQALPVSEFSTWARTVTVTDLKHTQPDASGLSTVTGTVVSNPDRVNLCNPDFNLILRNKDNKIIYGMTTTKGEPTFEERFPDTTDYTKTEAYVVQGVFTLGHASGARASCRSQ